MKFITLISLLIFLYIPNLIFSSPSEREAYEAYEDYLKEKKKKMISWSRSKHLELKQTNRFVFPVVQTILLIQCRSRTQTLSIVDQMSNIIYLEYLPPEMWFMILEHLKCSDFGPK